MRLKCYNQEPLSWPQFSIYVFFFFMSYPFSFYINQTSICTCNCSIKILMSIYFNCNFTCPSKKSGTPFLCKQYQHHVKLIWKGRPIQYFQWVTWVEDDKMCYNKFETWSWFELKIFNIYLFYLWSEIHYYVNKAYAKIYFITKWGVTNTRNCLLLIVFKINLLME